RERPREFLEWKESLVGRESREVRDPRRPRKQGSLFGQLRGPPREQLLDARRARDETRAPGPNDRSAADPSGDQAFLLQAPVGRLDGAAMDSQGRGELPGRGQARVLADRTGCDETLDRREELIGERCTAAARETDLARIQLARHRTNCTGHWAAGSTSDNTVDLQDQFICLEYLSKIYSASCAVLAELVFEGARELELSLRLREVLPLRESSADFLLETVELGIAVRQLADDRPAGRLVVGLQLEVPVLLQALQDHPREVEDPVRGDLHDDLPARSSSENG